MSQSSLATEFRISSLPLLTECAGSLVLPAAEFRTLEAIERTEEAAEWGDMVHHWKETGRVAHDNPRTRRAFERAIEESKVDRLSLWPDDGEHEVTVSICLDGSRRAVRGNPPDDNPAWMPGHVDYVRYAHDMLWDRFLIINDLKTAKRYYDRWTQEEVFRPNPRSPQLLGYALGISTADGYDGPTELQIDHWPKLPLASRLAGPVRYEAFLFPESRSEEWAKLEWVYQERQRKPIPDLRPGNHCKFCPSQGACLLNPN